MSNKSYFLADNFIDPLYFLDEGNLTNSINTPVPDIVIPGGFDLTTGEPIPDTIITGPIFSPSLSYYTLDSLRTIRTHLLIKIIIPQYKVNPADAYTSQVLTFSDLPLTTSVTLDGLSYSGLGRLLAVTQTRNELHPSSSELTITLSGIPNSSIYQIVNSKFKGSSVEMYRAFFDPVTGGILAVNPENGGNVMGRFRGFVNNYALNENYDVDNRTSDNTLNIICKSTVDVLTNKVNGRLTNPTSQKRFFPNDLSMDRVPALQGASYNFGAPG